MNRRQIDGFFATLGTALGVPARAYLTGAAAAALWGRVRPSIDVDFGLERRGRGHTASSWEAFAVAVERTSRLTGIPASVAEDIDRWGMITLLSYRRSSRLYRRFGLLEVRLLHPVNWSIGKLTRYLDPDVRDVTEVFRRQAIGVDRAVDTWGRALRASPASTVQSQFRRNVEHFIATQGRRIWGTAFDRDAALGRFHRAARISPRASRS
jgi:hypothetical protein